MASRERGQLLPYGCEASRLDLHELTTLRDVDDEAIDTHLPLGIRPGVPVLQRGVEGLLIEGADC